MKTMSTSTRRQFLRHTALAAGACAAFPAITYAQAGPSGATPWESNVMVAAHDEHSYRIARPQAKSAT